MNNIYKKLAIIWWYSIKICKMILKTKFLENTSLKVVDKNVSQDCHKVGWAK